MKRYGELFLLHQNLCWGGTLDKAIEYVQEATRKMLFYILTDTVGKDYADMIEENKSEKEAQSAVYKQRRAFLHKLTKANFWIILDSDIGEKYESSIDYLCKSNILWNDGGIITPIHVAMQNAINGYIFRTAS